MKTHTVGIIGCGDYLRWQLNDIKKSRYIQVKSLFDIDIKKSRDYAEKLDGTAVDSAEDIYRNPDIDTVFLFVPPHIRKGEVKKAAANNKHIITTKPMAPSIADAKEIINLTKNKVECALLYGRANDFLMDYLKDIFKSGEIGALALYKEDWIHHYPEWNSWAIDASKNGGPFLDAMIHELNAARYLMDAEITDFTFYSDNHSQAIPCNDTESIKINFKGNKSAHLFITWAGDLEVYSKKGNDRDHIAIQHMFTDKGWFIQVLWEDDGRKIKAQKNGQKKEWLVPEQKITCYDDFVSSAENKKKQKFDLTNALYDLIIIKEGQQNPGKNIIFADII